MYSPPLGAFLTRDPLPKPGEPDLLFDNNWLGARLTSIRKAFGTPNAGDVQIDSNGVLQLLTLRDQARNRRQDNEGLQRISAANAYEYAFSSPPNYVDPEGTTPWAAIACLCCAGASGLLCAELCAVDGYWDVPGEGFGSCFGKCGDALTDQTNIGLFSVTATCVASCSAWGLGKAGVL